MTTRFTNGFVLSPDVFWRPAYRISPFSTRFVALNKRLYDKGEIDESLIRNYFSERYLPTLNGRSAIGYALQHYKLDREDEVLILTTSGNKYISSCVTSEIEKRCKWSREVSAKTKLVFINHEFGYAYKDVEYLRSLGLPIIEDRALSFATKVSEEVSSLCDFTVFSLPKYFPISFGGVLTWHERVAFSISKQDEEMVRSFKILMTAYLPQTDNFRERRIKNLQYLQTCFSLLGYSPFFKLSNDDVPGVFMFQTPGLNKDDYKKFMQANGIESSVFYGEDACFIPVHHELSKEDMDVFFELTSYFKSNENK